jgi:hypothetical protein
MIRITTRTHVAGLTGKEITDFLSNCDDEAYQRWWPGTHLHMHTIRGRRGSIGSLVYMDEFIGERRVRLSGEITDLVAGTGMVWQLRHGVRLPVKLVLSLKDDASGVNITHCICAGYGGIGRLFDPLFRLWFASDFAAAMDKHARTEFAKLRDLLHPDV